MNKIKLAGVCVLALAVSFAFGRYSVNPPSTKAETEVTSESEKQVEKEVKKKSTTVSTEDPSGKKTTTTVTEEESTTHAQTKKSDENRHVETADAVLRKSLHIGVLIGADIQSPTKPIYGAEVSKEVLGPVTLGIFGLNNGTIGISIGVNF